VEFFDWAGKAAGLIDFALTSTQSAQETHDAVTQRLESSPTSSAFGDGGLGVRFKDPLNGGRKRKDGKKVEWYVTKPRFDNDNAPNVPRPLEEYFPTGRLDTPFFCHDVTDRSLRVPYAEPGIAEHPSGAKGILSVDVVVPQDSLESYARLYASVTGAEATVEKDDKTGSSRARLHLASPNPEALKDVHGRVGVDLRAPSGDADDEWVKQRGVGIRELRIYVPGLPGQSNETRLDSSGIGSSVLLVR
jgi:hypothetical protein